MATKPKEPAFNLPACYALKANLPLVSMRLQNVSDDTLFFVFYGMPGDLAQLAAAVIL
jgi:CCR4-NOT transcriptional regulation complex NOT5 subunit